MEDSFVWQEHVISLIRQWAKSSKLNSLEAFRCFDKDFDGLISKSDMRQSLTEYLMMKPEDILDTRLDRLFKVLSFYKSEQIQPSDFERLLKDNNPYVTATSGSVEQVFNKSMGGGFQTTSTQDWKFSCIQQIGLYISKNFSTVEDSFYAVSIQKDRIDFKHFMDFLSTYDVLKGFNLTKSLMQKLFGELDPHKKTYLNLTDWLSAFATFNEKEHLLIELKNFMQCQFANIDSAFYFLQSFASGKDTLNFKDFQTAAISMISSRKLRTDQIQFIFNRISGGREHFNKAQFDAEFSNIEFLGKQVINPRKGN